MSPDPRPEPEPGTEPGADRGLSRRRLLEVLGIGGVGAAVGVAGVAGLAQARAVGTDPGTSAATTDPTEAVAFHGAHQAGIVTAAQDRLHFAAFDITSTRRADVVTLLRTWTDAAAAMCAGLQVGSGTVPGRGTAGNPELPPADTGEALGLRPARLTLTIGFGAGLFTAADGTDRFGLAARRPPQLQQLPAFPGDELDPDRSGGDLGVQACSDDPQVAVHAIRNLARLAQGTAAVRWSQIGFGRTSSTSTAQQTPRNMMGFKDGTANLKAEDTDAVNRYVWVQPGDGPDWMTGGSYLVSRRIRMLIEAWDSTPLTEQERVIGRHKASGAPRGGTAEFDPIDLARRGPDGSPVIDVDAHIRLAHPTSNHGATLLRRGYSFVDGTDGLGRLDAGLFFLGYQRDPRTQFSRINATLTGNDALNEYIQHVGSGLFACPPGVEPGRFWGDALVG